MGINTQFPVAVHIMAVIAYFKDDPLPSDSIAMSIGTNPVVVRRIISHLKKSGLVDTQSGVRGAVLTRNPGDITLREIYCAVQSGRDSLFDMHPNPHPACPVGSSIAEALHAPLHSAQDALEKELGGHTLQDVLRSIRKQPRGKKSGGARHG